MPTFGSLFAGIGGIDLGLERAGWTCRWQVEWDAYCQRVLAAHWPDVPRYGDITAVDWAGIERVDLLAGGFPCQPVSVAGKRKAQADSRWLWPEFARAIRDLRPRLVLVENVPGLLARGMGDVLGDLASLGYDAEWQILSAADVGAPHLRKRVWIVAHATVGTNECGLAQSSQRSLAASDVEGHGAVAHAEGLGGELRAATTERPGRPASGGDAADALSDQLWDEPGRLGRQRPERLEPQWQGATVAGDDGAEGPLADADSGGLEGIRGSGLPDNADPSRRDDVDGRGGAMADAAWVQSRRSEQRAVGERAGAGGQSGTVADADEPGSQGYGRLDSERDGPGEWAAGPGGRPVNDWWLTEPDVGRVAHGVPSRVDRLRALGNAVVPQVAEVIGRQLIAALAPTTRSAADTSLPPPTAMDAWRPFRRPERAPRAV